jgi:hypothetical protein
VDRNRHASGTTFVQRLGSGEPGSRDARGRRPPRIRVSDTSKSGVVCRTAGVGNRRVSSGLGRNAKVMGGKFRLMGVLPPS